MQKGAKGMRLLHLKRVSFVMTLTFTVLLVLVVSLTLTQSRAKGQTASTTEERMTSYRTPTGPEMTPEAATNLAVNRWAREDGQMDGALAVTTVHTVFAQAMAVANGQAANEATYGGPADIAEWRTSTVYMITMKTTSGTFRPNVSVPRNQSAPSGSVMTVIIDAHTGMKEGLSLTAAPPTKLNELGPALQTNVPAVSSATTANHSVPMRKNVGAVIGRVDSGGRPVVGWHVVVGHKLPRHTMISKTYEDGAFGFSLKVGSYEIAAKRPNGRLCDKRTVRIKRRTRTEVNLSC
jgi:hypothetical protein